MALEPPPTQATTTSGRAPVRSRHLGPGLDADDPVQLPHHPGVRVGAHDRAEAVVRGLDRGHPVPHGLVDGVLQRPTAGRRRPHLGAEQPHAEDVQLLAVHVDLAHVDEALHAQQGGGGRRGHAVLAGAGLGHQPGLAHPLGQQGLAEDVVDLVGAGVVEVLPLEQHATAQLLAQSMALGQGRRSPGVVGQQPVQLGPEGRDRPRPRVKAASSSSQAGISDSGTKRPPNRPKRPSAAGSRHQRRPLDAVTIRSPPPSRRAPAAAVLVLVGGRRGPGRAATNARTLRGSLRPGDCSTPVDTSTPQGWTASMPSATFSGVSPPARITRRFTGMPSASDQSKTWPDPGRGASSSRASAPNSSQWLERRVAGGQRP